MNMASNPFKQLDVIRKASAQGRCITDCYRLMFKRDLWIKAYAKLAPNPGNMTKGTDDQTIDGFKLKMIDDLIRKLREGTFRFSPVRRTFIPKKTGKLRPLGIPNFKDKLVQEVCRMILENIYEPVFSENTHGFRPKRSCHTALSQIKNTWRGLVWCIEGDIEGFFDNISHTKLISILEKKIDDRRFLRLIHNALKCGYMEDWKYHKTYSGTPQGGIVSPILANIYLNELDSFMEKKMEEYNCGSIRGKSKEYNRLRAQIYRQKKIVEETDNQRESREWEGRTEHIQRIRNGKKLQRKIISIDPFDPGYRRMKYVRFADDFVIGIAGPKGDAEAIKAQVKEFLDQSLSLELSEKKTLITHLEKKVPFLGYHFSRWNREKVMRVLYKNYPHPRLKRTLSGAIRLEIPRQKMIEYAKKQRYGCLEMLKSNHRAKLINNSEVEILYIYNTELRGFANYYKLANNYHHLDRLFHIAQYSFLKTLAYKRKSTLGKVAKELSGHIQGEQCLLVGNRKGEKTPHKLIRLKHLPKPRGTIKVDESEVDITPNVIRYSRSTELEQKLMANRCEACGKTEGNMEIHHVRKLKDIRKKKNINNGERIMIERNRKTLVLCYDCHRLHHQKQIPIDQLESRMT
jgi:group II intron reverse transcriptase/maturase